jgi:hypothetical protein
MKKAKELDAPEPTNETARAMFEKKAQEKGLNII